MQPDHGSLWRYPSKRAYENIQQRNVPSSSSQVELPRQVDSAGSSSLNESSGPKSENVAADATRIANLMAESAAGHQQAETMHTASQIDARMAQDRQREATIGATSSDVALTQPGSTRAAYPLDSWSGEYEPPGQPSSRDIRPLYDPQSSEVPVDPAGKLIARQQVEEAIRDMAAQRSQWEEGRKAQPVWERRREEGRGQDKARAFDYPHREVHVENRVAGKSHVRLDAYDPGKEIVSRKTTQFANISEQTGTKYIKELVNKYPEGAKLAATDSNKGLIDGGQRVLSGQHILEVPRQEKPIPEAILQVARKNGVTIRETTSEANLSRRLPTRAS